LEEINEALVNLSGRPQVEEEVKRLHIERVEARSAIEAKALDAALNSGKIKEVETIGELSVIVGSEVDKDGNKLYPSRVQMLFATLKKEYQDALRGAKRGDVVETPFGSKFTVTVVYDIVPPDQQPVLPQPAVELHPAEQLPVTLTEEEEAVLVESLASAVEEIDAEKEAVEEQLVEDLAGQTAGIVPNLN
jgi:DNA-binding transcriptional regulator of glucitol operon